MSGVYIKGMEMPKGYIDVRIWHDGRVVCQGIRKFGETIATAIPVPDHGRLIDTRPLDVISFKSPEPGYEDKFMGGVLYMVDKIDNAPTIIPGEEGEE